MIFLVDEDHLAYGAWIVELGVRRHQVVTHWNATEAFRDLWQRPVAEVGAVLIDVMLASGDDTTTFPPDSWVVGLRLLRALSQQNPDVFPSRAVLVTNSIGEPLRRAISLGAELEVPVWDKRSVVSAAHFADKVEQFMALRRSL